MNAIVPMSVGAWAWRSQVARPIVLADGTSAEFPERLYEVIKLTQWDFVADLERLLALLEHDAGPRTMSSMVQAADVLVRRSRAEDPEGLERWLSDNAETLVGQQLLVANVHAQLSPATELRRVLHECAAQSRDRTAAAAVAWLKEEQPSLSWAWFAQQSRESDRR